MNKRASHRELLLDLLGDGKPHHMKECLQVGGFRYGARFFDMRKEGYDIRTIRVAEDEFCYQLHVKEPVQGALL